MESKKLPDAKPDISTTHGYGKRRKEKGLRCEQLPASAVIALSGRAFARLPQTPKRKPFATLKVDHLCANNSFD
jgi:hypothetical protein